MVVTVLKEKIKTVIIEQEVDGQMQQFPVDKVIGYNKCKLEVDDISTFMEDVSTKTQKIYKNRCLLRMYDGWVIVNHSFKELQNMKSLLHRKVNVKGFQYAKK